MLWPVLISGLTGFSVQGLQRPPYTLPRHRLLTCASACAFTTTERALLSAGSLNNLSIQPRKCVAMPLPVVRPLLITPGQCARFVDEELEYLTGVWPLGYCQELFIVCIYLCGQFLKSRKVANVTKTGKSTDERRHNSTSTFRICAIRGMRVAVCLMPLPDFANKKAPSY